MRIGFCKSYHLIRICFFVFAVFLFVGTIDTIYSQGNWAVNFLRSFIFTLTCALFCTVFLCSSIEIISGFRKSIFYPLFALEVTAGIFLGVVVSLSIIEQRIYFHKNIFFLSLLVGFFSSIMVTGYMFFRENLEKKIARIKEVEVENERLKRMELETRLKDLQEKVNPHFLFNTLNSIAALVYDNPAKAEKSIMHLSELYRKVLTLTGKSLVCIKEEIELIKDYLELEKLRLNEQLNYQILCPDTLENKKIPALLIEPLVENAVKHAQDLSNSSLYIKIKVEEKGSFIFIVVEDNGVGFHAERTDFGFGLFSIQERLRLQFGENHEFDVHSNPEKGTNIKVGFPK